MEGTYLSCLARPLRDIRSGLDTMREEKPFDIDVCRAVEKRVNFRRLEVVWAERLSRLKVGEEAPENRKVMAAQRIQIKSTYLTGSPLVDFVSKTAQEPDFPPLLTIYALFTPAFSFSAFSFAAESSSPTHPQYAVTSGPSTYCRSKSELISPTSDCSHGINVGLTAAPRIAFCADPPAT